MSKLILRKTLLRIAVIGAIAAFVFMGGMVALAAPPPAANDPNSVCNSCHTQENSTVLKNGEALSLRVDLSKLGGSVHQQLQCTSCHAYIEGIFHPAVKAVNLREYQLSQANLCIKCHSNAGIQMQNSVHRQQGVSDGATCTDCHGAHDVQKVGTASFKLGAAILCSNCHSNQNIMGKYSISTGVVDTYVQDFHNKTAVLLAQQSGGSHSAAAVCADCHGAHNIQQVNSPGSMVAPGNLANTCAKCHPGATPNFTSAWLSHKVPSTSEAPLVFFVRWFYRIMIPFIMVGLSVHILLDLRPLFRKKGT